MLWAAYFLARLKQFVFFSGSGSSSERIVYTRAEHPYVFDMITAGFVVVGLILLALAFSSCFHPRQRADSASTAGANSLVMKRLWQVVNTLLMISSLYGGWAAMQPDVRRNTNPDGILCGIVFVIMLLFPLGAVSYSIFGAKQMTLRRPSWSRFSLDWWHDPLQCLFLSSCFAAGLAIGAAFHLKGTTQTGFWTFMTFCSIFGGLAIGQTFVYAAYRSRLAEA
jgi:hypothetical protein